MMAVPWTLQGLVVIISLPAVYGADCGPSDAAGAIVGATFGGLIAGCFITALLIIKLLIPRRKCANCGQTLGAHPYSAMHDLGGSQKDLLHEEKTIGMSRAGSSKRLWRSWTGNGPAQRTSTFGENLTGEAALASVDGPSSLPSPPPRTTSNRTNPPSRSWRPSFFRRPPSQGGKVSAKQQPLSVKRKASAHNLKVSNDNIGVGSRNPSFQVEKDGMPTAIPIPEPEVNLLPFANDIILSAPEKAPDLNSEDKDTTDIVEEIDVFMKELEEVEDKLINNDLPQPAVESTPVATVSKSSGMAVASVTASLTSSTAVAQGSSNTTSKPTGNKGSMANRFLAAIADKKEEKAPVMRTRSVNRGKDDVSTDSKKPIKHPGVARHGSMPDATPKPSTAVKAMVSQLSSTPQEGKEDIKSKKVSPRLPPSTNIPAVSSRPPATLPKETLKSGVPASSSVPNISSKPSLPTNKQVTTSAGKRPASIGETSPEQAIDEDEYYIGFPESEPERSSGLAQSLSYPGPSSMPHTDQGDYLDMSGGERLEAENYIEMTGDPSASEQMDDYITMESSVPVIAATSKVVKPKLKKPISEPPKSAGFLKRLFKLQMVDKAPKKPKAKVKGSGSLQAFGSSQKATGALQMRGRAPMAVPLPAIPAYDGSDDDMYVDTVYSDEYGDLYETLEQHGNKVVSDSAAKPSTGRNLVTAELRHDSALDDLKNTPMPKGNVRRLRDHWVKKQT